jgi:glutamate-1-semialdehyde 2,1-aminomutase
MPGGVNSNVKMAELPHPLFFVRAEGSRLFDCDGNVYIDYTCGYGPVVLGHANPVVVAALQRAATKGFVYGGQHEDEVRLAERLIETVPCFEMVRFNSTGSEAVAAAVRLARAYTGRTRIVRFAGHYHGWLDEQLVSTHPAPDDDSLACLESVGQVPSAADHLIVAPWNHTATLERLFNEHAREIAGVLMEPIMCNSGVIMPSEGYLERARALCSQHGAVLIFDEVITGFRVHLGGAQALLGVTPDLAVFGKAMANGFPLSCLGGRRDIMEMIASGGVVHAGTFNGNPLGVAAALATLDELERDGGAAYRRLTATGQRLMHGIREVATARGIPVLLQGPGPVFYMWFTDAPSVTDYRSSASISREPYQRLSTALLASGVRVIPGGRWYVTCSHTEEDVDRTIEAMDAALQWTQSNA